MKERRLIFISHANPDDNEFAVWLGTRLTAAGYDVWADVLNLLGGATTWRNIGDTIKEETAAVVVALSHSSYKKNGVLDEIALSVSTGLKLRKNSFVIPIRLDNLPFSDFPEQLIRLNAIDFFPNWADGFGKLLKTFKDTHVPQSACDLGEALADWLKFKLRQSTSTSNIPELLSSNWFPINSLPSHINFSSFNASQKDVNLAFSKFESPAVPYQQLAVSFADATTLQTEISPSNIPIKHAYRIPLAQFLKGQAANVPQASRQSAQNIVTCLFRKAWERFARSQGLLLCEFVLGSAYFVPLDLIEKNIAIFQDKKGKKRQRRLVGRSNTRGVYWHFAVSGKVSISDPRHLALRPHVVFTQDGKTPIDDKFRAARLRRSFCKNWWNDRWRDMLCAFAVVLSNGKEQFSLALGGEALATIAASPMGFDAPMSIPEAGPVLTDGEDRVEDETEADDLDDLNDLDKWEFEDQLDDENER